MTLLAIWNRYYYSKNHLGHLLRHSFVRDEIKRNLRVSRKGRGAKAWKRLEKLTKNDFHLIGNIYLT